MASSGVSINDFVIKIVGGSLRGTEFPVRSEAFTLGRSSEADIKVHDTLISRVHCRVSFEDGRWYVEDLNSTNGTWMAGQKVEGRNYLPYRTSIRVGKTIFELLNLNYDDDTKSITNKLLTYRIQPETLAATPHPDGEAKVLGEAEVAVRNEGKRLAAIYKFQTVISSELDEKQLYTKIVGAVCNVLPVDKAFLLMFDLDRGEFVPICGRSREGRIKSIGENEINRKIINFVKEKSEAVLFLEPCEPKLPAGVAAAGLPGLTTSIMCVPLLGKQQINGMLYVSLTGTNEKFSEDDLRLLTVLGHTSGMAIEHNKMLHFNQRNERLVATGTTAAELSHYIKNILAGLDGSLNLIRLGIDEKDFNLADEAWHILHKNHLRLSHVVLDLLNLASEQKPQFELHNVESIIKDAVDLFTTQLSQEGIDISFKPVEGGVPLQAEIDAKGINRVLLNLITNSEHAILSKKEKLEDKDAGHITISAGLNDTRNMLVVSVKDDGMGMEREDMKKIFDLFVTSKGNAGTGLGLAVCKRIVEAHSGAISASGEKGKGTSITFTLPMTHNEMNTNTIAISRMVSAQ